MLIVLGMLFTGCCTAIARLRAKRTELSGKIGTPAHEGHAETAQIRAVEAGADTGSHAALIDAGTGTSLALY